jgi:hypothetical protein
MKTFLIVILTAVGLTGCASGCTHACLFGFGPGNGAFDAIGLAMDRSDPCQTGAGNEARRQELNRPEGYQRPAACSGGKSPQRITVNDRLGNTTGYVIPSNGSGRAVITDKLGNTVGYVTK